MLVGLFALVVFWGLFVLFVVVDVGLLFVFCFTARLLFVGVYVVYVMI